MLGDLRERAVSLAPEWVEARLMTGLLVAWRYAPLEGERVHWLALKRDDGLPHWKEVRAVLGAVPLAPTQRTTAPKKRAFVFVLAGRACAGCGGPLCADAKIRLRTNCLACPQENERVCVHGCGRLIPKAKATNLHACGPCRGKLEEERRERERAAGH